MNEMVAADGETVAVARHLPDGQFGVRGLDTRSDCAATPVNGIETIRI